LLCRRPLHHPPLQGLDQAIPLRHDLDFDIRAIPQMVAMADD
jgi:hypothetical protein